MVETVFHLPLGVDFATELVAGLKDRVAGPPEAMARVRLFVNSRRMQKRVTDVFVAGGASFLPQIAVVSDLQDDPILADLPPIVPDLRRRLELSQLVGALLTAQPDLAPTTARFDLADSLLALADEMQDEEVPPSAIAALDVSGHSAHWARTQAFLEIVTPLVLSRDDAKSRQREAVLRLKRGWEAEPPRDMVVIAGSTGSRGTTALLMQAISALPHGAVVLPGFDTDLGGDVWQAMGDAMTGENHPQYRYRRLMAALDLAPSALRPWRHMKPADQARNRLVSLALRPAPVTDQWSMEGPGLGDLKDASAGITLIEASGPREEAAAIALALRRALDLGQRAALISPDRGLTRRVAAALARWGILAEDTAGSPLALSPAGRFLRLVARGFTGAMTSDALLTLLKHPLAGSGPSRLVHLETVRRWESQVRRFGPAFPTADAVQTWAESAGVSPWAAALAPVLNAMAPGLPIHLSVHVARHIRVAEALARGVDSESGLWLEAGGLSARSLLADLEAEAPAGEVMSAADYRALFETLIQKAEVRDQAPGHPQIAFYGHREAREMHADVVVLGEMTDGVWPASADPDPWLNRRMRRDAGLLLPERQIGLAAHDFQQAMAAKEVILTRATRDAEAETVPSRWLNRLCNLMEGLPLSRGPEALEAMRGRGRELLAVARALERPTSALLAEPGLQKAVRPSPQPPASARPRKLSLTQISRLIRDPYAVYARQVLRLYPLDPLRQVAEVQERGTAVHKILEAWLLGRPTAETEAEAHARLLAVSEHVLREETPFPTARILWQARMERAAGHVLAQDAKHLGTTVLVEGRGEIVVTGDFVLYGTPDRIDLLPDGRLHLIDYKTGTPPTEKQQDHFDKQLLLAASMAERGGFPGVGPSEVARITYVGLGAGDKAVETVLEADLLSEHWARFVALIERYARETTGYTARRAVFETRYAGDYDHLARFGEWQMSDNATSLSVGSSDGTN